MKVTLPIDRHLDDILQKLDRAANLVLVAEPGAGKTTRLPPALLNRFKNQILVLEPRRVAAIAAADRVAEENGFRLGDEVGYQVRFEAKTSAKTRLIYMTEALLARKLLADPELRGVDGGARRISRTIAACRSGLGFAARTARTSPPENCRYVGNSRS
jgi:ATP-dependent helicase HrpB